MKRLTQSIRRRRGASTTEALVVLVLGILIAGGAVAVLAPGLTGAAAQALEPLGVEWSPGDAGDSTNAIWYVVFAFLGFGFLGFFVAPMVFPGARSRRESVISTMSGTFPILQVFADQDARADRGLGELRALGDEVKRMQGRPKQVSPNGGSPAPSNHAGDGPVVVNDADADASEEPTVSRDVVGIDGADEADSISQNGESPVRPRQTGKEAAIAAIPSLEPLSSSGEEPTIQLSREKIDERMAEQPSKPSSRPDRSPVIRKLEGVRAADYKAPEPVVGDADATLVRSDSKLKRPIIDELDEPTNVLPDRKSILERAARVGDVAGPDDPTHLRDALADEDLRETVSQPAFDPAGPDADTNELFPDE